MEMNLVDNLERFQKNRLDELKANLRTTLREIFQIDSPDLNFGVYRIMNQKRTKIENFLNYEIFDAVDDEFRKYDISSSLSDVHKAEVFAHLEEFFSRYYVDGDFLPLRRYSNGESKYLVPYNGEEIYLHWANKDQYYIKTDSFMNNHGFNIGEYKIKFEVIASDETHGGNNTTFKFVLCNFDSSIEYSEDTKTLTLRFKRITYPTKKDDKNIVDKKLAQLYPPHTIPELVNYILSNQSIPSGLSEKLRGSEKDDNKPEVLKKHLVAFTKKTTSDFFIHKDLRNFLNNELDHYIKIEIFHLEDLLNQDREDFEQVIIISRIFKSLSQKIIQFISQLEDFQKALWEKKKFIFNSNYCITVDYIPDSFYTTICKNEEQINEWNELYGFADNTVTLPNGQQTFTDENEIQIDPDFLRENPYLMVDTRFYPESFKEELLDSLINPKTRSDKIIDLDEAITGLIIHSENWQALNMLKETYHDSIRCTYIDPPYNTESNEIIYRNNYKHSTWMTLMENRLALSKSLAQHESVLIVAIDDAEIENLSLLLSSMYPSYERSNITIVSNPSGKQGNFFNTSHDYACFVYPKINKIIGKEIRTDKPDIRPFRDNSGNNNLREDAANCFYPIYIKDMKIIGFGEVCDDSYHPPSANVLMDNGVIAVYPIDKKIEKKWVFERGTVESIIDELSVITTKSKKNDGKILYDIKRTKSIMNFKTVWTNDKNSSISKYSANSNGSLLLKKLFKTPEFTFPKSIYTVEDCLRAGLGDSKSGIVLDFFGGSGTTANAVLNLNRNGYDLKYILVEIGDYFKTTTIPRVQKNVFSDKWKNGVALKNDKNKFDGQPHIFKYFELEQYDDSLNNIVFAEKDNTHQTTLSFADDYFLTYYLEFETKDSPCRLNIKKLVNPFEYTLKKQLSEDIVESTDEVNSENIITVDLVETFNYLLGLHVLRIVTKINDKSGLKYRFVNGKTRDEKLVTIVWRNCPIDPENHKEELEADAKFIESTLQELQFKYKELYVNGHCFVKDSKPIEPIFKRLMGA